MRDWTVGGEKQHLSVRRETARVDRHVLGKFCQSGTMPGIPLLPDMDEGIMGVSPVRDAVEELVAKR